MATLKNSLGLRAALLSLLIFAAIVGLWQIAAQPTAGTGPAVDPEYAKLVGAAAATGSKSAMPRSEEHTSESSHAITSRMPSSA